MELKKPNFSRHLVTCTTQQFAILTLLVKRSKQLYVVTTLDTQLVILTAIVVQFNVA